MRWDFRENEKRELEQEHKRKAGVSSRGGFTLIGKLISWQGKIVSDFVYFHRYLYINQTQNYIY
jgi:hypothetical protein